MHPVLTIRHYGHLLHDDAADLLHRLDSQLHGHHCWFLAACALLLLAALWIMLLLKPSLPSPPTYDDLQYGYPFYRV